MKIKKVLLADDDADDREIFIRVLGNKTDVQLIRDHFSFTINWDSSIIL